MKKSIKLIVASFFLVSSIPVSTFADKYITNSSTNNAKASFVYDPNNKQAIYTHNSNKELPIASLSKLMSLYLVSSAINHKQLSWNTKLKINNKLVKLSKDSSYGSFKLKTNHSYTVKQLYQLALIASSNSAIMELADKVAGNEQSFVNRMNAQAKKWKINAKFVTCSGLDKGDLKKYNLVPSNKGNFENLVSAKAITIIGSHLLTVFPKITDWSKFTTLKIDNEAVDNSNRLLTSPYFYKAKNHVDGLKTGYTERAGLCILITYYHNHHRLLATILGSTASFSTSDALLSKLNQTITNRSIKVNMNNNEERHIQFSSIPKYVWFNKDSNSSTMLNAYQQDNQYYVKNPLNNNGITLLKNKIVHKKSVRKQPVHKKTTRKKLSHHKSLLTEIINMLKHVILSIFNFLINENYKYVRTCSFINF